MIRPIGDFVGQIRSYGAEFVRQLTEQAEPPLERLGRQIEKEVRHVITNRETKGPPLRATTVARKGHDVKMIGSAEYLNSISVTVKRHPLLFRVRVVVAPVAHMQLIGRIHEYGTTHTPARPHWRPALFRVWRGQSGFKRFLRGKWFRMKWKN